MLAKTKRKRVVTSLNQVYLRVERVQQQQVQMSQIARIDPRLLQPTRRIKRKESDSIHHNS
jgi:hypothetical protein